MERSCLSIALLVLVLGVGGERDRDISRIDLRVATSACNLSGTDSRFLLYLGQLDNSTGRLMQLIGPFELDTKDGRFEVGSLDNDSYPMNEAVIQETTKCLWTRPRRPSLCLPAADVLFVEKLARNALIAEPMAAWKPLRFDVRINFKHPMTGEQRRLLFHHELSEVCDSGWLNADGVYQIGPHPEQLKYRGSDVENSLKLGQVVI